MISEFEIRTKQRESIRSSIPSPLFFYSIEQKTDIGKEIPTDGRSEVTDGKKTVPIPEDPQKKDRDSFEISVFLRDTSTIFHKKPPLLTARN